MNQVAEGNARGLAGNRFADGWESEAISQAYARAANQPYLTRGTEPRTLGGEALRSTVALAMGRQPDLLPENLDPDFLAKGLDQPLFSAEGDNKPIDVVASSIRDLGGDQAQVTIVPITITSNTEGAVTVPLFRVETADGPKFVDHNGDQYRSVRHWEETNKLPKGKMTYAEGLDLGNATLKTANTPGVVDSFAEAFGEALDYAALAVLGVGVVVAVVGSGGQRRPAHRASHDCRGRLGGGASRTIGLRPRRPRARSSRHVRPAGAQRHAEPRRKHAVGRGGRQGGHGHEGNGGSGARGRPRDRRAAGGRDRGRRRGRGGCRCADVGELGQDVRPRKGRRTGGHRLLGRDDGGHEPRGRPCRDGHRRYGEDGAPPRDGHRLSDDAEPRDAARRGRRALRRRPGRADDGRADRVRGHPATRPAHRGPPRHRRAEDLCGGRADRPAVPPAVG